MTVKEDFISLFQGHESELESLPESHFPLKDFSYMITSQRTTSQILRKLQLVNTGNLQGTQHQNFWSDLRRLGLVNQTQNNLSLFGKAVLEYFESETDNFKREHFIFNGIRQKSYDVPQSVFDEYNQFLKNLYDCIRIIPAVNIPRQEIINNPEKLLITAFLNSFPYALKKYYELSSPRQNAIDNLRESGLKRLFQHPQKNEKPYAKVAQRLWNIWRALDRRVVFVKSAILSYYEERCIASKDPITFETTGEFQKLLNDDLLQELVKNSDKIEFIETDDSRVIRVIPEMVSAVPRHIATRRRKMVRSRRTIVRRHITNPESLIQRPIERNPSNVTIPDPLEAVQLVELRDERTRDHQEIVRKLAQMYLHNGITPDENNFDLLVEAGDFIIIHEMKTITNSNERNQIIKAVGQLFYYEFYEIPQVLENNRKKVVKIIVLQSKPSDLTHIEFLKSLDISILWIGDTGEIEGETESIAFIKSLLNR